MQQPFTIKNVTFGEGQPVVCVPVVARTKEEILSEIRLLAEAGVPMVEWRVDWFCQVEDEQAVEEILQDIKPLVERMVFLFTFRTKKQGGNSAIAEKKILQLNIIAAQSGTADIIDLEFFEATFPLKEIRRFQSYGVKIIASHHDFDGTPEESVIRMLLNKMQQGGADIVKLAVMPKNREHVLRLLKITAEMKEAFPSLPVVTISMGTYGLPSRICGEIFGSCITFGSARQASAPGQIPYQDLSQMLDLVHKYGGIVE